MNKKEQEAMRQALMALVDIENRAKRIREDKAIVGVEATFIERIAKQAINKIDALVKP